MKKTIRKYDDLKVTVASKQADAGTDKSLPGDINTSVSLDTLVDIDYILKKLPLTKRGLQRLRSKGIIPYIRIANGRTMYREKDVQEVIMRNYKKAKNS